LPSVTETSKVTPSLRCSHTHGRSATWF
jgi:hypothetical protein